MDPKIENHEPEDSSNSWTVWGLLGLLLLILGAIYLNGMHKHQVGKAVGPSEAEIREASQDNLLPIED